MMAHLCHYSSVSLNYDMIITAGLEMFLPLLALFPQDVSLHNMSLISLCPATAALRSIVTLYHFISSQFSLSFFRICRPKWNPSKLKLQLSFHIKQESKAEEHYEAKLADSNGDLYPVPSHAGTNGNHPCFPYFLCTTPDFALAFRDFLMISWQDPVTLEAWSSSLQKTARYARKMVLPAIKLWKGGGRERRSPKH